ncbi:uncharacterized protein [Amphiura filiformis]|uniref:uncharacterized protein n=1 Tax=Amphiura filiformis TaxID=82378 RepID=UPI003B221F82
MEVFFACDKRPDEKLQNNCMGDWYSGSSSEFLFFNNESDLSSLLFIPTDTYITPIYIIYYELFNLEEPEDFQGMFFVCGNKINTTDLDCAFVTLNSSEYLLKDNETLLVYSGMEFQSSDFIILPNQDAQVCYNSFSDLHLDVVEQLTLSITPLDIVSFITTTMSMFGELGTLTTYIRFKQLRNIYGHGIMSLSFALFIAQLFTLLPETFSMSDRVCVTFGVIKHYFWLATFTWTSIIAFILFYQFGWKQLQLIPKSNMVSGILQVLGWGLPLLVSGSVVSLHFLLVSSDDGKVYGGEDCWIIAEFTNVLAFGLPVALSIVLNTTLAVLTMIKLRKANQTSNRLRNQVDKRETWREAVLFTKGQAELNTAPENTMKNLTEFFRLIICIEITSIIHLYRSLHDETSLPELAINGPGYKFGQPLLSWKISKSKAMPQGYHVPSYLREYNTISHRLGYKIRQANEPFFQCNERVNNGHRPDVWCSLYRRFVDYRISNFEDADVKFTDYIPGLYEHVTYKANLVSRGGKYIPKGFHLPEQINEFLQYSSLPENCRDKKWVQKHPWHRGNTLKEFDELDLRKKSIIQEFIGNPFLIDGRKFSIGVHVAFTSARPLRAYVLDSIMVLRFCAKAYTPNNLTDFRSYISDGMEFGAQFIRQMDSLKNFSLKQHYSTTQSLYAYVDLLGGNSSTINIQISDAIQDVLSTRNDLIGKNVDSRSRYFQWTRWDFILDSNLKVHLMEANNNPAMSSVTVRADRQDEQICHNTVYNLFRVLGIASFYDFHKANIPYVIRDSDIHVEKAICYTSVCNLCKSKECQLCSKCLSDTDRDILKSVFWEHLRRGETRRVYPIVIEQPTEPDGDSISRTYNSSSTADNALTKEWLRLKCLLDIQWCNIIK